MGQYYRAIVLKPAYKRCKNTENAIVATLSSYNYDNGAKLMEHSYVHNEFVEAAMKLLAGKGYGLPFVWCGDYYEDFKLDHCELGNLYSHSSDWLDRHARHLDKVIKATPFEDWNYIINFDKMLYVKVPHFNPSKLTIHPLPILCCAGNGMGSGDYFLDEDDPNFDLIGSWAFDRIGVSKHRPAPKFKSLKVKFK